MPYRKLLCGIDFSEHAHAAMTVAVELAVKFEATLTLVHVTPLPPVVPDVAAGQLYVQVLAHDAQMLAEWKVQAERLGARQVETVSLPGVAWSAIIETARRGQHDAIVVGTHGRSGILAVLIGSVTERVVRHAPCSVVVVRRTEPARR